MLVGAGHSLQLFHASIQSILIDPAGKQTRIATCMVKQLCSG